MSVQKRAVTGSAKGRISRVIGVALVAALVGTGAAACGSSTSASKGAEAFGPAAYRGLTPGMTKDAALATGALEKDPVSQLGGCTDFTYKGGPAPDAGRMAAETAADAKLKDLNAKADAAEKAAPKLDPLPPNASAREAAEYAQRAAAAATQDAAAAQVMADASQAQAEVMKLREARDKAFLTAGRVSFGVNGLRELTGPAGARTAEGIGTGSTVDDLKKAYGSRGLDLAKNGRYQLPVDGQQGWQYEFTVDGSKVSGMALVNHDIKCS